MDDASLFSSLVVSRPVGRGPDVRRAALVLLAGSFHVVMLGTAVLTPLFLPEVVDAPKATVPIITFTQPRVLSPRSRGRTGPPPGSRQGGGPGGRTVQPAAIPIEPPPPNAESAPLLDPSIAPALNPIPGLPPGAGDPNGSPGSGGSASGCPGCPPGEGGGRDTGPDADGPISEARADLTQPVLIPESRALPKYPDLPRRARIEGTVVLLIIIERDGSVGEVQVVRSPDQRWGFDLAALEAVKQWRYRPGLLAGRPVAVQASVMVEFVLSR